MAGMSGPEQERQGGWTTKALPAVADQPQGQVPSRDATVPPSHITPVLVSRLRRWANRLRGRYGVPIYLCGSALREDNPDPRDWDVRIMLPDDDFALKFGPVDEWRDEGCTGNWTRTRFRWSDQCVKDTQDFAAWVHLNGDVQIYPESFAATLYADQPRLRLDTFPDDASAVREREGNALHDGAIYDPAGCPRGFTDCSPLSRIASPGFESFMCCGETASAPVPTDRLRLCIKSTHKTGVDLLVNLDERDVVHTAAVLMGGLASLGSVRITASNSEADGFNTAEGQP